MKWQAMFKPTWLNLLATAIIVLVIYFIYPTIFYYTVGAGCLGNPPSCATATGINLEFIPVIIVTYLLVSFATNNLVKSKRK